METDLSKYIGKSFVMGKSLVYVFHATRDPSQEKGPYKYKIYYYDKLRNMISMQFMSDTRMRGLKKTDANLRREAYERVFNLVFGDISTDRNKAISEGIHFSTLMLEWGNINVDLPRIK
jgi:hypothetical protein